jgi:hypothetical protein
MRGCFESDRKNTPFVYETDKSEFMYLSAKNNWQKAVQKKKYNFVFLYLSLSNLIFFGIRDET